MRTLTLKDRLLLLEQVKRHLLIEDISNYWIITANEEGYLFDGITHGNLPLSWPTDAAELAHISCTESWSQATDSGAAFPIIVNGHTIGALLLFGLPSTPDALNILKKVSDQFVNSCQ